MPSPRALRPLALALVAAPAAAPTAWASPAPQDGGVTSPDDFLEGRTLGADFFLADWSEVSGYHRLLAAESDRVQLQTLGTTEEGRDFLLTVVSSPENLARLGAIQGANRILSDPRGCSEEEIARALDQGRVTLFVSPGMHSTETSPAQFGMEFAYRLATSEEEPWASARRELVVGIFPCTNPDGLDHVASWYREHVHTPYEATGLDRLYQLYAGHDNNRDWFMLSLAETRLVTEQLYAVWRPQVYWDVHEQGRSRERFFVPPFRDPLNPNVDPAVITGIDLLGTRALFDMNHAGLTGISTGVSYDMWWTGGNRNVPTRHNIIGLLTEAASVRLATPVFLPVTDLSSPRGLSAYGPSNRFPNPWPGGWWRLSDVIDYELAFGESLLASLSREPRMWRENALELARRALERGRAEGPRAWLLPPDTNPDLSAVRRLVGVLLSTGVELSVAAGELELDGRRWPAGTVVIRRDQPYGSHVKDLFEVQRYPAGDPPYDIAGWTLPLLLGVHRVEVMQPLGDVELSPVTAVAGALAAFRGDPRVAAFPGALDARDAATWTALAAALGRGEAHAWIAEGERAGLFVPAAAPGEGEGEGEGEEPARVLAALPRVGLYAPWSGHMPEGWMRWVFDAFEVPYVRVRNEALRAGALGRWLDVLVLPGSPGDQLDEGRPPGSVPEELTRGLDPEGAVAIEEFVRTGGTLVAVGQSSEWAVDLFRLPLADVTRGEGAEGFSCPGSVVRTVPEPSPLTAGLPPSVPVFFSRSSAWRELEEEEAEEQAEEAAGEGERNAAQAVEVLLRYAPRRTLLSGWIQEPQVIAGRVAWARAPYGDGSVHVLGFRPQYRSWSQGAFGPLFRAVFLR